MVTAALRSVFTQENAGDILSRWDDLAVSLAERFPKASKLMFEAREKSGAPTCRHWWMSHGEVRSAKLTIKRITRFIGIFANAAAITSLVVAMQLEFDERWQRIDI
jgi:transposase-like protein